jgi:hypothetical protein
MDDVLLSALAATLSRLEGYLPVVLQAADTGQTAATGRAARLADARTRLTRTLAEHGRPDPRAALIVRANDRRIAGIREGNPEFERADAFGREGREGGYQITLWALQQRAALAAMRLSPVATDALYRATVCAHFIGGDFLEVLAQELAPHLPPDRDAATVILDARDLLAQLAGDVTYDREAGAIISNASELYQYIGPMDRLVRPFCREHIGRVYTKAQIAALDPTRDVFLTRGGDECRHVWTRVSRFSDELYRLHATGEREQWMADILARNPPRHTP